MRNIRCGAVDEDKYRHEQGILRHEKSVSFHEVSHTHTFPEKRVEIPLDVESGYHLKGQRIIQYWHVWYT